MTKQRFTTNFARTLAALAFAATLQAGVNRTFVSTAGNDANASTSCGPTTPCRTFAVALSVTNSGGEIVVLTSGGYGPFTINQPVTINAIGVDASITQATSGENGITINTTGNVTISGLGVHGAEVANSGIYVSNVGFLRLYSVTVESFSYGIFFAPSSNGNLAIHDSHFSDNGGTGVIIETSGYAYVKNSAADHNTWGFYQTAGNAVIEDSTSQNNSIGFVEEGGTLSLNRFVSVQNVHGIDIGSGSIQLAYCTIAQNSYYAIDMSGGTVTGSNPGTNLVTGTIVGTLGTAATLK